MSLGGIRIERGYADGEFFTAEPQSDTVLSVAGTDGEVAASVSYDARWNATIKLLETSDENKKMVQLWNLKKRGNGMVGFFPFLAKDADTGETLTALDACISRPPNISKDRTATTREWRLLLCNAEYLKV
jgi:Protein of unknown function (DUF3277)